MAQKAHESYTTPQRWFQTKRLPLYFVVGGTFVGANSRRLGAVVSKLHSAFWIFVRFATRASLSAWQCCKSVCHRWVSTLCAACCIWASSVQYMFGSASLERAVWRLP